MKNNTNPNIHDDKNNLSGGCVQFVWHAKSFLNLSSGEMGTISCVCERNCMKPQQNCKL